MIPETQELTSLIFFLQYYLCLPLFVITTMDSWIIDNITTDYTKHKAENRAEGGCAGIYFWNISENARKV